MEVTVVIADDQKIILEGLQAIIKKMPGIRVIDIATDGRMAVELVKRYSPHIALIDVMMAGLNGFEATYQIVASGTKTKVIALSVHANPLFVKRMLKVGASGYVVKDCTPQELEKAIHTVMLNQKYFSPQIFDLLINDYLYLKEKIDDPVIDLLSPKEREILQCIAEGKTIKQIAFHFCVSTKTIETYKQKLMDKLNLYTIADLTKFAIREGLTTL
jgi:DNA-binding NarL/FixJ family response regulator